MKYTYEDYFKFMTRNIGDFSLDTTDDNGICGFSLGTQHIYKNTLEEIFDEFLDAEKEFGTGKTSYDKMIERLESEEPAPYLDKYVVDLDILAEYLKKYDKKVFYK
jgi:hypothetical protein